MRSPAERLKLYNRLHEVLGPTEADTLMELLPASAAATQVSVDEFRAETRASIEGLRAETRESIEGLRAETRASIEGLRAETRESIEGLRAETRESIEGLRAETRAGSDALRAELGHRVDRVFVAVIASNSVVVASIVGAVVTLIHFG